MTFVKFYPYRLTPVNRFATPARCYNIGMRNILFTAFEPFDGRGENASLLAMAAIRPSAFRGRRLHRARLPVDGLAVERRLPRLLADLKPELLVSLGLAAGETAVRVERFALNIKDYRIKDNAGRRPEGRPVYRQGPAAYIVNTDPAAMAAAARRAGVPAVVSNHAGAYVCNHLMYAAMRAIDEGGLDTRFAFIHLPLTTEMALAENPGVPVPPSLPLPALARAVEQAALAALRG